MNSTQENKSNSSKFIFISVILVTILVILVLCLSFTAFKKATSEDGTNPSNDSNGNGGINSKISMTYTENMNGISIQDALPTSDEVGKHLNGKGGGNKKLATGGTSASASDIIENLKNICIK